MTNTRRGYIMFMRQDTPPGYYRKRREVLQMIKNEKTDQTSDRKKMRGEDERRDLMNRLKRIEGQVRGLQRMIDEDAYCPDVLTQASAVNSAINSFCKVLLANHIRTCVANDIRAGRDETVDELVTTLQKLMK